MTTTEPDPSLNPVSVDGATLDAMLLAQQQLVAVAMTHNKILLDVQTQLEEMQLLLSELSAIRDRQK